MVLPLVSHELERIWKELSMAYWRYEVGIQGHTGMTLCLWISGCRGFKASQWLHLKLKQSSKCWQPLTQQHSIKSQTQIPSKSAIRTSNLMLYIFRTSILHWENLTPICCTKFYLLNNAPTRFFLIDGHLQGDHKFFWHVQFMVQLIS